MKKVLSVAAPIMLSYLPLGLAAGILAGKCGIGPALAFFVSITLITGGGQFMISNLWLTGVPALSIVASVGALSLRFALYSASLAPYLQKANKRMSLALSYTLIEEAYGVTLAKFSEGQKSWTYGHALALNVVTILTWAGANAAGSAIGSVVDIPTALASFVMTSLFICLLWTQLTCRNNVIAAATAIASVIVLKLVGLSNVAVPVAAVIGVACAFIASGAQTKNQDETNETSTTNGAREEQTA